MNNQFEWVDFYKEFAYALLGYKEHRAELIEKVKAIYTRTEIKMPTLERGELLDIDPFTVFALFGKKLRPENRIKILTSIADLFDIREKVPVSFSGLPTLNPQNATYYYFLGQRGEHDIDDLWELFESALRYAESQTLEWQKMVEHYFDLVIQRSGNGNSKLTMALYWIAPDCFLNLDNRNEWFIYESGRVPEDVVHSLPVVEKKIPAKKYFQLIEKMHAYLQSSYSQWNDFKELSFEAWRYSEQVNQEKKGKKLAATDSVVIDENVAKIGADIEDVDEMDPEDFTYTKKDFIEEVFMTDENYDQLSAILHRKKNIILQGAPGVGKTFAAKRLAYSIMGAKDDSRVAMVQFHQSYTYEDFIMGFRPTCSGFELRKGIFYNFCKKAEVDIDHAYFFIIDEINRGNLSKIFGELFMLIESDKRGTPVQLLYTDEVFTVPENVYIIGMMNTADRSLAMLDYALRRRFAFFEIEPGFEISGFINYRQSLDNKKFDILIERVENLNRAIAADESLGKGFCIGHSFFCNLTQEKIDDQTLFGIVEYELIPLLQEYWFDEPEKVEKWSHELRGAIQ